MVDDVKGRDGDQTQQDRDAYDLGCAHGAPPFLLARPALVLLGSRSGFSFHSPFRSPPGDGFRRRAGPPCGRPAAR
jgi:hypothetical protein